MNLKDYLLSLLKHGLPEPERKCLRLKVSLRG